MTRKRIFAAFGACTAVALSVAASPAAANDWKAWDGQAEASPRAIYTDGTDSESALLACGTDGMLSAMITLEPASLPELLAKNAPYSRLEKASIMVGSAEATETKVRVIPAINAIEARSHNAAAKVFNAAIKGELLKVSVKHAGDIETLLPAPNAAFKAFARTCKESREAGPES